MHQRIGLCCSRALQYTSIAALYIQAVWLQTVYPYLRARWAQYWSPALKEIRPSKQYFLDMEREDLEKYLTVPEGVIYVEEWWDFNGVKRYVVRYAGETIPRVWTASPLDKTPKCPWLYVGDRETEINLTRKFDKFLVVGNKITKDLVSRLVYTTSKTKLMYIQAETFKELEFPGEGLTIEEYDDNGPLQSCGPVHRDEKAVCSPVLGGHTDKTE